MRVLILGGNGRTGQLAVTEALKRGHTVTALIRSPTSLHARFGLTIVTGTPLSRPDIEAAFSATAADPPQAVLVALNASRASDSPFAAPVAPPLMMRDAVANVTSVMEAHGTRKIVIMSAFGVGGSFAQLAWPLRLLFRRSNMAAQFEDHDAVDTEVRKLAGVQWVMFRPVMLKEGEAKEVKEWGDEGRGVGMFAGVTRESVAGRLVDAVESERWNGQTPVISN